MDSPKSFPTHSLVLWPATALWNVWGKVTIAGLGGKLRLLWDPLPTMAQRRWNHSTPCRPAAQILHTEGLAVMGQSSREACFWANVRFNLGMPWNVCEGSGLCRSGISRYGNELQEFGSLLLNDPYVPMLWNLGKFWLKWANILTGHG